MVIKEATRNTNALIIRKYMLLFSVINTYFLSLPLMFKVKCIILLFDRWNINLGILLSIMLPLCIIIFISRYWFSVFKELLVE